MIGVVYQKKFLKDLAGIPTQMRQDIEHFVFDILPTLNTLAEAGKFEKMTGYEHFVKARFGDYRIGAHFYKNRRELRRVLNRKEIYRYFP
jgi:mRNA interferase RelE/StbE